MIQASKFGEITQIRMGREVGSQAPDGFSGEVFYWTSAYLVDGLLIDTGCPHTAEEFAKFLEGKNVKLAVNTHFHEDHIGANHLLQKNFNLKILASRESIHLIDKVHRIHQYQELVWATPCPQKSSRCPIE